MIFRKLRRNQKTVRGEKKICSKSELEQTQREAKQAQHRQPSAANSRYYKWHDPSFRDHEEDEHGIKHKPRVTEALQLISVRDPANKHFRSEVDAEYVLDDLYVNGRRDEILGVVESHVRVEADPTRVNGDDGEGPVVENLFVG